MAELDFASGVGSEFQLAKGKLDDFFIQWLSLPESQELVSTLILGAKTGKINNAVPFSIVPSITKSPPPRSPTGKQRKDVHSDSPSRQSYSVQKDHSLPNNSGSGAEIPPFFFPKKLAHDDSSVAQQEKEAILTAFSHSPKGMTDAEFKELCTAVLQVPSYFATTFFARLDTESTGFVKLPQFLAFWEKMLRQKSQAERFFNIIRDESRQHIEHNDLLPFMKEVLLTHPGLEFLKATPEFQERYAETVIVRIFYTINTAGNGHLTLREIEASNFVEIFLLVDAEKDINKITQYFSYEHFYVLYCKFWELDTDHDFYIDKEDLLRYANYSLTYRIVDRIFSEAPRKMTSTVPDKMCYADFIWFLLSEEDKTSSTSLTYWFRCVDLNGDGYLQPDEIEYLYREQMHRMECLSLEVVSFADILCQLCDMIHPQNHHKIALHEIKRCRLGNNFFNIMFNLNKFIAYEQRDPAVIFQERMTPELTDWDRFAHAEYVRLSLEEDGDEYGDGSEQEQGLDSPSKEAAPGGQF